MHKLSLKFAHNYEFFRLRLGRRLAGSIRADDLATPAGVVSRALIGDPYVTLV